MYDVVTPQGHSNLLSAHADIFTGPLSQKIVMGEGWSFVKQKKNFM
jgi:hypothetical protein